MSLIVLEPGLQSWLIDAGRPNYRHLGIPCGGPADRASWQLGNALLGNPTNALAVEITLHGPVLEALDLTGLVIFGAPFQSWRSGGAAIVPGMTLTLEKGERLTVGGTPSAVRGYLCVAGGFIAPARLGSRSAWTPLKAGDILSCASSRCQGRSLPFVNLDQWLSGEDECDAVHLLRVLPGPQRDWFPGSDWQQCLYRVSPASNRMGVRLIGPAIPRRTARELLSEPVAPGAIQVTHDGQPIILGVDGQSLGGYPKLAQVIRADLDRIGQLRPGDCVCLQEVTWEAAEAAAILRRKHLQHWLRRLQITGSSHVPNVQPGSS